MLPFSASCRSLISKAFAPDNIFGRHRLLRCHPGWRTRRDAHDLPLRSFCPYLGRCLQSLQHAGHNRGWVEARLPWLHLRHCKRPENDRFGRSGKITTTNIRQAAASAWATSISCIRTGTPIRRDHASSISRGWFHNRINSRSRPQGPLSKVTTQKSPLLLEVLSTLNMAP